MPSNQKQFASVTVGGVTTTGFVKKIYGSKTFESIGDNHVGGTQDKVTVTEFFLDGPALLGGGFVFNKQIAKRA